MRNSLNSILAQYKGDFSYWLDNVRLTSRELLNIKERYKRLRFNRNKQYLFIIDYLTNVKFSSAKNALNTIIIGVDKSGDDPLKKEVAIDMLAALKEGESILVGMRKWFNRDLLEIFAAGEQSNQLTQVLELYIKQERTMKEYAGKLLKKMVVPAYIFTVAIVAAFYLVSTDFLGFESFAKVDVWPEPSQRMYHTSTFLVGWFELITLVLTVAIVGAKRLLKSNTSSLRLTLDRAFPFKLYKVLTSVKVFQLMAILKITGRSNADVVATVQRNSNPYVRYFFNLMQRNVERGLQNFGEVIDVGLFPPRLVSRVYGAYEQADESVVAEALIQISDTAEKEAEQSLGRVQILLPLCSWLVAGGLVYTILYGLGILIINSSSLAGS
jgi:type II secretory pathway component PulF